MKIRRALATAAATAVIAPLALLSAPVAFASDGTPDTSTTAPAAEQSTPTSDESTPAADQSSQAAGSEDTAGDDSGSAAGEDDSAGDDSGSGSDTAADTGSDADSDKAPVAGTGTASSSSSTSTTATPSGEPSEWPEDCPVDEDGVDADSQLSLSVDGLPGKIVAGSGWHNFKLTAANHSDTSLGTVQWLAIIDNDSLSDDEKDWLGTYAKIEYFNPKTKAWESIADEIGNGFYFGETELGPKETVGIKLRVDITAKAPAGDGFTVGLGGYVDAEKNCVHSSYSLYEFTVLKPGSSNDDPGEAKPGKGDKPAGGKQPQGGADEIPATGSLASTGSSSALPVIGLVGGVAVVAGGGALFMVRRRKVDAQA
ncbi:LPXTG cell wall anchor domain-containing protein [Streptomyces sp. NPDC002088]|uniref:LPXTG cell wall anchor domain-containing protein n=1 Tax=Streptomyces sp. NPDC002088 TaxID=3154665 RepID=UPI003320FD56